MKIVTADTWPDNDLHAQTMRNVFGIPYDEQESLKGIRVSAKTYFFAALYGGEAYTIHERLEKVALENPELSIEVPPIADIARKLHMLHDIYGGYFFGFVPNAIERARHQTGGTVYTAYGRPRTIPQLYAKDKSERQAGERYVPSHIVQGTAGDIARIATNKAAKIPHGRILIQVHDELVAEVDKDAATWYTEAMVEAMLLDQPFLPVPLIVTVKQGENWKECHG